MCSVVSCFFFSPSQHGYYNLHFPKLFIFLGEIPVQVFCPFFKIERIDRRVLRVLYIFHIQVPEWRCDFKVFSPCQYLVFNQKLYFQFRKFFYTMLERKDGKDFWVGARCAQVLSTQGRRECPSVGGACFSLGPLGSAVHGVTNAAT